MAACHCLARREHNCFHEMFLLLGLSEFWWLFNLVLCCVYMCNYGDVNWLCFFSVVGSLVTETSRITTIIPVIVVIVSRFSGDYFVVILFGHCCSFDNYVNARLSNQYSRPMSSDRRRASDTHTRQGHRDLLLQNQINNRSLVFVWQRSIVARWRARRRRLIQMQD